MRVLHLTRDFPPQHRGGLSTAVHSLVAASRRAGWDVALCSFDDWRPRRAAAAPDGGAPGEAQVFRVRSADDLTTAGRWAAAMRPQLIQVHDGMLWTFAEALRGELGVPLLGCVHVLQRELNRLRGSDEPTASLRGQDALLRAADLVLVPSASAAGVVLRDFPAVATRLRVVGHGFDDSPTARAAVAARPAQEGGPVLYAGRFADAKGTQDLLAAIPLIVERVPTAEFVFAGGVPGNRAAERRFVARWERASRAALRARVTFTGWLSAAALSAHYAAAAVIAVPSRSETFGLVAGEAMLHGLPVVAAAAGALPELVEHERSGLSYPPGDVTALAAAVAALLLDRPRARRLGEQAAADVRATRSWQAVLPALHAVYREALG